jgi:hypothetical protein
LVEHRVCNARVWSSSLHVSKFLKARFFRAFFIFKSSNLFDGSFPSMLYAKARLGADCVARRHTTSKFRRGIVNEELAL